MGFRDIAIVTWNVLSFALLIGFFIFMAHLIADDITPKEAYGENTVIVLEGKRYVLYGLVGEGKTHVNKVPVYSAVFVPEERIEDAK